MNVTCIFTVLFEESVNVYFFISDENQQFLSDFKQLILETYAKNGNKKVVIIAHSLGNLYTTYLLSKQSQSWKDKYISSYINMAGPLGGAAKIMRLMASGIFALLI